MRGCRVELLGGGITVIHRFGIGGLVAGFHGAMSGPAAARRRSAPRFRGKDAVLAAAARARAKAARGAGLAARPFRDSPAPPEVAT